ncbi:2-methylaconitate cis-trans isomerase PrpF family protein [Xanthobacter aminoxidans]|uniref:2-methylaconitate cis-trans isomerase PrpF family protein n=1 Tax=Xanthobacter aminoxidans TaxID=186280 RepID=UPI00372985C6
MAAQRSIPAVFMRGGTSKALMFHARDLPPDRATWDELFAAAMGSPDPYGRQLDGMGGGLSSLSKVCVVGPSQRPDADVDYTFAQVAIGASRVDYSGNCGNMTSAVGPFALDEMMLASQEGGEARVRIFNTNTSKLIHATFPVEDGCARFDGDLAIPGVSGTGAPIRLDFIDPAGASTGRLLPTGAVRDVLDVPGLGRIEVSMVDAANAAVFVRAEDVGLTGHEAPQELDARADVLARLDAIRCTASVAMGIAPDVEAARRIPVIPFICFVASAKAGAEGDLVIRAISNGQPHRALPLTISLCAAAAAQMDGSVVAECRRPERSAGPMRLAMPAGVLTVDADVVPTPDGWQVRSGSFYRTARRLFDGRVWVPGHIGMAAGGRV